MPINFLMDLAVGHLKSIQFERPRADHHYTPRYSLKRCLLDGNGIDVHAIDEKSFRISMQPERYYEAISTDFYYSYEKVSRQRDVMELMLKSELTPGAWLLVTAYYKSFYSAIEIARLLGMYNLSLDTGQLNDLNQLNYSMSKLSSSGVYHGDGVFFDPSDNSIKIRFTHIKSKPHQHAWFNLDGSMKNQEINRLSNSKRIPRIQIFKDIVGSSLSWPMPSSLRNDWNYSIINSYSRDFDYKSKILKHILDDVGFNAAKSWADKKKVVINDQEIAASMGYVSSVLECVMNNLKGRLIC